MAENESNWVNFTHTHWSLIMSAKEDDTTGRERALAALCQSYWPPIYAYIRQRGHARADAQDLTQEFFARFLEKDYLQSLTHQNGKFRSFLLACVNHMLSDTYAKQRAQKRGGHQLHIPLEEFATWESELGPIQQPNNEELSFDRTWARTVLRRATDRLADDYRSRGKSELFDQLKFFAPGADQTARYEDVTDRLGLSNDALRAAVHRMRVKFGQFIREEVGQTLTNPEDLESEIQYLINVISGE